MRRVLFRVALISGCLLAGLRGAHGAEPDADEQALKAAGLATDGPALLAFLRKRVPTEATAARVRELVKGLGDESFEVREKSSAGLVGIGRAALPALRAAAKDDDAEVAHRAAECLRKIEADAGPALASAAVRLLAARKPPEAAATLLDYLPFADGDDVAEQVRESLPALAVRDGKPDPALVKALDDKLPPRRAAAAEALGRAGVKDRRDALVRLLKDEDPLVRQRAAFGLLALRDKEAVPALIDLLGALPPERGWETEDVLARLAGEDAPPRKGDDEKALAEWRAAWHGWWKKDADKADLGAVARAPRYLGYTLGVLMTAGKVVETDRDGKVRWEIGRLVSPLDAVVLPGDRVLIVEAGRPVTERTVKGEIVWTHEINGAVAAQRLPNGNTFIVTHDRLVEVRRDGSEVSSIKPGNVTTAQKLPDGRIYCHTEDGRCRLLDASGKEVRNFAAPAATTSSLSVAGLPAGHVLVTDYSGGAAREYDAAGKVVWEVKVGQPLSAQRLPSGNTIVSAQDNTVVEFDRDGKVLKTDKMDGHPTRVRRR